MSPVGNATFWPGLNRQDVIDMVLKDWHDDDAYRVIDQHCLVGNVLWTVERWHFGAGESKLIVAYEIVSRRNGRGRLAETQWGFSTATEGKIASLTCPLKFFDAVPIARDAKWRHDVRDVNGLLEGRTSNDVALLAEGLHL